ncbi:Uncharacterised protein r2_g1780 [Pycnogonum litorale]
MVSLKNFAALMLAILFFGVEVDNVNMNELIETCKKITGAIEEAFDEVNCNEQVAKDTIKIYESCANNTVTDIKIRCIRKVMFQVCKKYSLATFCFGNNKPCGPFPA